MTTHDLTGAKPEAMLTRARGGIVLFHMQGDDKVADWVVSFRQAKALFWCQHRGWIQVGRTILLN